MIDAVIELKGREVELAIEYSAAMELNGDIGGRDGLAVQDWWVVSVGGRRSAWRNRVIQKHLVNSEADLIDELCEEDLFA